MIKKRWKRWS